MGCTSVDHLYGMCGASVTEVDFAICWWSCSCGPSGDTLLENDFLSAPPNFIPLVGGDGRDIQQPLANSDPSTQIPRIACFKVFPCESMLLSVGEMKLNRFNSF